MSRAHNNVEGGTALDFRPWQWLFQRQTSSGCPRRFANTSIPYGLPAGVVPSLYSNMKCVNSWDPLKTSDHTHHKAIFNFDFSPDGKLLVAACEGGSVLFFDPLNASLINHKNKAHSDCVNCVRFLDSRLFATCSDDTTVALWDARYLKNKVRTLSGHLSWVKNIEYASNIGLLVTSGFDGCVYTWNINNYSESEPSFKHVFHTGGLMRSKLTPDNSRLIISLSRGYIIVIHDLDLFTLSTDLHGFKPNMYRLIQLSTEMPIRMEHLEQYNHHFQRSRNRIEFISDFPKDVDAEVISSLQIHPQGWCILTRSTSSNEQTEFTCVHDIQKIDPATGQLGNNGVKKKRLRTSSQSSEGQSWAISPCLRPINFKTSSSLSDRDVEDEETSVRPSNVGVEETLSDTEETEEDDGEEDAEDSPGGNSGSVQIDMAIFEELFRASPIQRHAHESDHEQPDLATIRIPASEGHPERLVLNRSVQSDSNLSGAASSPGTSTGSSTSNPDPSGQRTDAARALEREAAQALEYLTFRLTGGTREAPRKRKLEDKPPARNKNRILENQPRLVCYAEEPNVGRGFIKEQCFSTDGRLVCSPFGWGVRLLAFNPSCAELCDCVPETPVKMYEVASNMCHSHVVVTSKFSPVHCLLVSGCLNGKASFCQPVL